MDQFSYYVSCFSLLCCHVCSSPVGKGLIYWLSCVLCFFCVFVTFPYVSGFTSEQMVRSAPLNMFKFSSNFTDRSKAVLILWIFFDYLCFMIVFVIVYCLFLAAAL